jgi:predicted XRE-type DNA-binding protein
MKKLEERKPNSSLKNGIEKELECIKKLMILWLMKAGATQDEIGAALGMDQSAVSRMLQGKKIKKFNETK